MDTILAAGAKGECPERLIGLLDATGHPPEPTGSVDQVDAEVLNAVERFQVANHIVEPAEIQVTLQDGQQAVIKGTLVGQQTWDALYAQAAARLGLVAPADQVKAADQVTKTAIEQAAVDPTQEPTSVITGTSIPQSGTVHDPAEPTPAEVAQANAENAGAEAFPAKPANPVGG
jgi:hypothetical protein